MTLSNFHEKRAAQVGRCRELADKNRQKSEELHAQAHRMADVIPFGQPILVGHYSERSDRNYRARISKTFDRSMEAHDKAQYYERKADRMENNQAISQDDPDAIRNLKDKLAELEKKQERMKAANRIIKSTKKTEAQKIAELANIGIPEQVARELMKPDFCGRLGYPDYETTNNSANMRRIKQRIEELEKSRNIETTEQAIGDIRIIDSAEENRIQIFFPGKPDEQTRARLKQSGFRWAPSSGCWQAYRNNRSRYYADQFIAEIAKQTITLPVYVNPTLIPVAQEV